MSYRDLDTQMLGQMERIADALEATAKSLAEVNTCLESLERAAHIFIDEKGYPRP